MIKRDSVRVTHGLLGRVFAWKTVLGRGRTRPNSLIVIAKGGHLFSFGAHVCRVVRLFPLQGWLLIRISMTPSDMGDGLFSECKRRT
jgi:hypothetical protein